MRIAETNAVIRNFNLVIGARRFQVFKLVQFVLGQLPAVNFYQRRLPSAVNFRALFTRL